LRAANECSNFSPDEIMTELLNSRVRTYAAPLLCQVILIGQIAMSTYAWAAGESSAAPSTRPDEKQYNVPTGGMVNLSNGKPGLGLPLGTVSGENGLAYHVTAQFNGNVQFAVGANNAKAPTGALGLGWTLDFPKILVDTKTPVHAKTIRYILKVAAKKCCCSAPARPPPATISTRRRT
jgi:hypothetical protein